MSLVKMEGMKTEKQNAEKKRKVVKKIHRRSESSTSEEEPILPM